MPVLGNVFHRPAVPELLSGQHSGLKLFVRVEKWHKLTAAPGSPAVHNFHFYCSRLAALLAACFKALARFFVQRKDTCVLRIRIHWDNRKSRITPRNALEHLSVRNVTTHVT